MNIGIHSERVTLANLSAEQSLLGTLLAKPALVEHIPASFDPEQFSDPFHDEIFRSIVDLGQSSTPLSVSHAVALGDAERAEYVKKLVLAMIGLSASDVRAHCSVITDFWRRRVLADIAHNSSATTAEIRSALEAILETEDVAQHTSRLIDPTSLDGLEAPSREWIVPQWLPARNVTLNYGAGGVGKTLLAQQLMTSCATGTPWCGLAVTPCRSIALFCEDDEDELWRRQEAINRQAGITFRDLGDMRWQSGVGEDNLLMTFDGSGRGILTPRFRKLVEDAEKVQARLLVIDTAADVFGGNENDRSQVRQFVGRALGSIARQLNGAVILNAHPSRSGMSAAGDMDGGSTGWSNTARSRWSLVRPPADDDAAASSDERVLTKRKANYSGIGDEIRLRWQEGVLVPLAGAGGILGTIKRRAAEDVFLSLLDEAERAGRRISDSKHSGNFAPKVFAKSPNSEGHSARELAAAMERLFSAGTIRMTTYGRTGDARQCIARAP